MRLIVVPEGLPCPPGGSPTTHGPPSRPSRPSSKRIPPPVCPEAPAHFPLLFSPLFFPLHFPSFFMAMPSVRPSQVFRTPNLPQTPPPAKCNLRVIYPPPPCRWTLPELLTPPSACLPDKPRLFMRENGQIPTGVVASPSNAQANTKDGNWRVGGGAGNSM